MKKRVFSSLFASLILCWLVVPAHAQIVFPGTPDQYIIPPGTNPFTFSPTNTAEVEIPAGSGTPLQVMVWDGPNPSFGWDYAGATGNAPILGTGLGTVRNPDIVADPSAPPGDERVLIIYHVNFTDAYFEVHSWNGFAFVPTVGPTLLSTGGTPVTHPNVDIYFDGRTVMTWSEGGAIYAQGYILPALSLSPNIFKPSSCFSVSCDRSDVGVFKPIGAPGNRSNFIFVADFGGTEELIVQRASWGQVWSGAPAVCGGSFTNTLDAVVVGNEQFGVPRIACPNRLFPGLYVREDASAVCLKYDNSSSTYTIYNYTHHAGTFGPNVFNQNKINTNPFDLSPCGNKYPAISYVGEFILTTWTYEDCLGIINGDLDVLVRQLNFDGSLIFPDYSLLNQNINGDQLYSAIDGKFSTTQDAFYSWQDNDQEAVGYKFSFFTNLSLRKATTTDLVEAEAAETSAFSMYPNPMLNNATFTFGLLDGELAEGLEVYDISGRLIDRLSLTNAAVGNNLVDWETSDMPAGVYLVKLITDQRAESIRITKQ